MKFEDLKTGMWIFYKPYGNHYRMTKLTKNVHGQVKWDAICENRITEGFYQGAAENMVQQEPCGQIPPPDEPPKPHCQDGGY